MSRQTRWFVVDGYGVDRAGPYVHREAAEAVMAVLDRHVVGDHEILEIASREKDANGVVGEVKFDADCPVVKDLSGRVLVKCLKVDGNRAFIEAVIQDDNTGEALRTFYPCWLEPGWTLHIGDIKIPIGVTEKQGDQRSPGRRA